MGATARVWGNDAAQIALTADARRNQVWVIDPFRFAQAVADGADIETARGILLRTATTNRYTGGVRGAWAATPWLGFNALFEAGSGTDPAPENENVTVSEWALLAGFDMKPLWSVPLGLFTGYRGQSSSGRTSDLGGSTSTYAIGLLYTGRPHYLIGVDASLGRADVNEVDISKIDLVQVRLVTRFDF